MDPKSSFAIKLLEKIGAPLIKAVEKPSSSSEENAEIIARLLGQAVKMSIALNSTLGVEETEAQADSTRMALAAIASPLLADFYETHQKEPEEQDIQRMIKSMEVVMSFADKFKPAEEGQSRLSTIDHSTPFFDNTQSVLNTMLAMTPVIPPIYEFSFGQEENKLMQEVAAKLEKKAHALAGEDKIGQILVLQALANIYADCHRAATAQIAQSDEGARQSPSMEPVWQDFDKRALMLGALNGGKNEGASSASVAPSASPQEVPVAQEQHAEQVVSQEQKEEQKPVIFSGAPMEEKPQPVTAPDSHQAPPPASPAQQPASGGGGNPMSFFSKGDNQSEPASEPSAPPAKAEKPAAPTPPSKPKDETASNFEESGKQNESSNPMSFFGKKKDGE